ncbi:MAG: type II toxin-antitoxin system VapC family toxin [Deltaproteobacteria bacterium]|nr:type II toxin-antitoxin system VapC family toxin [Deltaproteobacteria bacterium]
MRVLIDSHVALWLDADRRRLRRKTLQLLTRASTEVLISTVTCAELAIKLRRGKLRLDAPLSQWWATRTSAYDWRVLPLLPSHAAAVVDLGGEHRDPFDLLLAAQARTESVALVTADPVFAAFGVSVIEA